MATIIIAVAVAFVLAFAIYAARYRGKRIVACPETGQPVGAEIGAVRAAAARLAGDSRVVITSCSRWPEKADCDQACAPAIAASPRETLVTEIVTRWYAGHACVLCGRQIQELDGAIVPALRIGEKSVPWLDVPAEELPAVMNRAVAVCASCDLAEDFRRLHPELVTERVHIDTPVQKLPSPSAGTY
jgi:hypothetical protein